ncbi:MAG: S-layer homology domain-containing protein [Oscillospiraceae bacterium]|nr:S-layer homology domain-containing protein [Oscillospiraceae bacterium]
MKKWKKALALLLAMAMCLSMLSVSAFAEGEESSEGGGPGGDMGGGSTASGAETIEVSGMEGMLSLYKYVFEAPGSTISVKCYGTYRADSATGEEAYGVEGAVAYATYGVYTDSDLTEAADGVTASITVSGNLQVKGVATEGNVVYYLWNGETDSVATIIYVVNDEYDEDSATLTLTNGDTVDLTKYAPNMADGDYTADQATVNDEGVVYIGGNRTVTDAEYYGITDEYAEAVDWYLSSGITNGGASLEEFGDNMYNFEYVVAIYRMFQLVNEQMTYASDFVDASDYVAGMGSNDQFSDAVSATMASGIWNGIYSKYSSTELPTASIVANAENNYLLTNITGSDGKTVTELGVFNTTTVEFVYVGLFNAFQSAWSQLNDEGVSVAANLAELAATYDSEHDIKTSEGNDGYSNEAKIYAIATKLLGEEPLAGDAALSKVETVAVLYAASQYIESVSYADSETAKAVGSSYADMTQYFGNVLTSDNYATLTEKTTVSSLVGGIQSSSNDTWLIMTSADLTNVCFGVLSDDTANSVIYASSNYTGIDGMAAAMGGITAEYADATGTGFIYNATFRNAYYREALGSGVAIVGEGTVVTLKSTNGSLVLSGSGGSMAGTAYVGFGAMLKITNSAAYSSSQHLTNNLYNGTVYYYESLAYGTGRLFSSDFWGGYQVYVNSVGYGGNVTDEPTTLIVKNSVYSNSVGGNGFASQYFENSVLNVGTASFHNTTSLITDIGSLTLVNSVMDNTSDTLVTVSKGENVIVTLVDSEVTLSGTSVASIAASTSINHSDSLDKTSEAWVSEEYAAMFDSEVYLYVYGTNYIYTTDGSLTADVADGATLKIFVSETNDALDALVASYEKSSATVEIVTGDEYGTLEVVVDGLTYNDDGTVSFNAKDFCSFTSGGTSDEDNDYAFTAYLYLNDGTELYNGTGVSATKGTYTGIEISDSNSGRNAIVVVDSDATFENLTITLDTLADGSDTCDFSGKGSALAVYGDSNVTVKNATIETTGVATMPVFVDDGATLTIYSSTLISNGGTMYETYMNSPDQSTMVAPPWILGIMGTSRCTNLMGNDSTMNVIDSETSAGAWAVLSTDSGSNMYLNIYNTTLTLNNTDESESAALQDNSNGIAQIYETNDNPYSVTYGSGYGTYVIGSAVETFAGATVNVGTYASIFTGGTAVYTNIVEGETYTLYSADGENDITYTASTSKVTTINSDTFGFMIHQNANYITIENGTVVNSGYATFLVKSGSSSESVTATIDNAELNNGGVLIQVMDNDDATNGGMMSADDENNTNGGNMNFQTTHSEKSGFATSATEADDSVQTFTFTNGTYTGNIYNGSGTDRSTETGALDATTLDVTFGSGAVYMGAIASTATIHVTYEGSVAVKAQGGYAFDDTVSAAKFAVNYQNTSFDITHYYDIGQVANKILEDGAPINITLTDDAVWYVDGTSVISTLTIEDDARVEIANGETLTINGVEYTGTLTAGTYGIDDEPDEPAVIDFAQLADDTYSDVDYDDCYAEYIGAATYYGIVEGYENGTFGLGNNLTRAEAATLIVRVYIGEDNLVAGNGGFSDVDDSEWYAEYIATAAAAGIVNGYGDGTFLPGNYVTRAEFAKMVIYAEGLQASTINPSISFSDVTDSVNQWYYTVVYQAATAGLVNGMGDGTFAPTANITREQAVTILCRAQLGME